MAARLWLAELESWFSDPISATLEARARVDEWLAMAADPNVKPASRRNLRRVDSFIFSSPLNEVRIRQHML